MVMIVEALFSMEPSELMTAPAIAANIKPLRPVGIRLRINSGNAASDVRVRCS